jgi:hypothetical protein
MPTLQPTRVKVNWPDLTSRHGPRRKHLSSVAVQLLSWKYGTLRSRYLATAAV